MKRTRSLDKETSVSNASSSQPSQGQSHASSSQPTQPQVSTQPRGESTQPQESGRWEQATHAPPNSDASVWGRWFS
ncbi:hypothetical protein Bca4012_046518 [Brassica carinata]